MHSSFEDIEARRAFRALGVGGIEAKCCENPYQLFSIKDTTICPPTRCPTLDQQVRRRHYQLSQLHQLNNEEIFKYPSSGTPSIFIRYNNILSMTETPLQGAVMSTDASTPCRALAALSCFRNVQKASSENKQLSVRSPLPRTSDERLAQSPPRFRSNYLSNST